MHLVKNSGGKNVVLLVHGIRTRAWWQGKVASLIESESNLIAIPIKYGRFDLLRFILPFKFLRRKTINQIESKIIDAQHHYGNVDISIIAHSFGSYALSEILLKNPKISFRHIILCGSIVRKDFPWDRVSAQVSSLDLRKSIINECGLKDIFPILAASLTWGYRASGTDGFGTTIVKDRFYSLRHSDFFEEEFVRENWISVFNENELVVSKDEKQGITPPSYFALARFPLKYILVLALSIFLSFSINEYVPDSHLRVSSALESFQARLWAKGLSKIPIGSKSAVLYATQPGGVAMDQSKNSGDNSPFTYALTKVLDEGVTDISYIGPKVAEFVRKETNDQQSPYFENKLSESVNLAEKKYKKIALIVGNSDYSDHLFLGTPKNDAIEISKALDKKGFLTILTLDADRERMIKATQEFLDILRASSANTVALLYFAGHGFQYKNVNYMMPIGGVLETKNDIHTHALSINEILIEMEKTPVKYSILILDACRNPYFEEQAPITPQEEGELKTEMVVDSKYTEYEEQEMAFKLELDEFAYDRVKTYFENKCKSCHGEGKSAYLAFPYTTLEKMVLESNLVTVGSAKYSTVYNIVASGRMPVKSKSSEIEIGLLECWIDAGAYTRASYTRGIKINQPPQFLYTHPCSKYFL